MPSAMAAKKAASGAPLPLVAVARQLDGAAQGRAGGEAARDVDRDAVVLERQRIDDARLVGGEIVVGDRRAAGLQVGGDVARQAAFVEFARAAVGQPPHRLAEIAELEVAPVVPAQSIAGTRPSSQQVGGLARPGTWRGAARRWRSSPACTSRVPCRAGRARRRAPARPSTSACRSAPAPWRGPRPCRARRSSGSRPRSSARGCRARRRDWRGRGRRSCRPTGRASWPRRGRSRPSRRGLPWRSRSS